MTDRHATSLLDYLGRLAFPGRRIAWGKIRRSGRGASGGGEREAFDWPASRGFPRGVNLTPEIGAAGVLRRVPIDGEVAQADLHLVPSEAGMWCLAVEADEDGPSVGGVSGASSRQLEKQDILLHTIVHDLASPLSGIVGCLTAIEDGVEKGEDLKRLVALALRQAHRQERLIEQILDVFRADHEPKSDVTAIPPDLGRVVRRLVESLEPSFALHGVQLRLDDRRRHTPSRVVSEETRLERVLANLLDNGLRHAPEGSAVVVRLEDDAERATVSVLDEGPGVPPDRRDELFQKLRQGESRGKLGLGLYFCRITVQRWGGRIGYAPRGERGAKFWFDLPRADLGGASTERPPITRSGDARLRESG